MGKVIDLHGEQQHTVKNDQNINQPQNFIYMLDKITI